jgi:Rrf2 family protein
MISKKAKYAIKSLIYLAKHTGEGPILISQIAEAERIPRKFLEAILLELKRAAILASKKGKGGGYYLMKPASEINLAEVMRVIDGPLALLPCVTHRFYQRCEECIDEATCGIRDVFAELRSATVDLLKSATLDNLINREQNFRAK